MRKKPMSSFCGKISEEEGGRLAVINGWDEIQAKII